MLFMRHEGEQEHCQGRLTPEAGTMLKALLVDDSALFRKTFKDALQESVPSLRIEEAEGGNNALEKVENFAPDLIFIDIRLREESGLQLTRTIKQSHPEIVTVILTHYDLPEYREAADDVGADGFIVKGALDLSEITALVGLLISDRKRRSIADETKP